VAVALLIAVRPFKRRLQSMITCFRSKPNRPRTGVEIKATPRPSIPERNDSTNKRIGSRKYSIVTSSRTAPTGTVGDRPERQFASFLLWSVS